MQWLFDIVEEMMEAAGFLKAAYIDRGTHPASDFVLGDLVVDGVFHDLDLSSIVPVGAKGVNIHIPAKSTVITDVFYLKPKSHPVTFASCTIRPQIANHITCIRRAFAIDSDRIMEYRFTGVGWNYIRLTVKGWWL